MKFKLWINEDLFSSRHENAGSLPSILVPDRERHLYHTSIDNLKWTYRPIHTHNHSSKMEKLSWWKFSLICSQSARSLLLHLACSNLKLPILMLRKSPGGKMSLTRREFWVFEVGTTVGYNQSNERKKLAVDVVASADTTNFVAKYYTWLVFEKFSFLRANCLLHIWTRTDDIFICLIDSVPCT